MSFTRREKALGSIFDAASLRIDELEAERDQAIARAEAAEQELRDLRAATSPLPAEVPAQPIAEDDHQPSGVS